MGVEASSSMVPFSNTEGKSYALSGRIMLSAIVILFFVVVLMVGLHLYARWYLLRARRRQLLLRRRSRMNHERRTQIIFYADNNPNGLWVSDPANRGLEPAVLNSLPHFVYSSKTQPELMDCAVCLSEFEENEMGRVLPKCKHSFHIECIDMWFHSHSTCPLCRAPVERCFSHESEENKNSDVVIELGESDGTIIEPGCSSSQPCASCKGEDGEYDGSTSLGVRRKGMEFAAVRIDIPTRSELENEMILTSPASTQGYRSPGARLLSLKRILSMGRKTPTTPPTATPRGAGAGASCSVSAIELESDRGTTELTRRLTPR